VRLDPTFSKELLKLRLKLDLPMKPSSICRCKAHNKKVGGKARSFHICDKVAWAMLEGCGAGDFKYTDKTYRNTLARLAYELGWRIGYNKTFLHIDIAHMKGITELPKFFKYGNVSDAEFEQFKREITGV
jgi:hypothetical protein